MDVAVYFCETIIRNNPSIKWGYVTESKDLSLINRPILLGFASDEKLEPYNAINELAIQSSKEKCGTRLLDLYNEWMKK
jgi:hypothetical protein